MGISIQQIKNHFTKESSIAPIVTFRVIIGLLLIFSTLRFMYLGWVETHFIEPILHFKYFGFYWVKVLSPELMYLIHYALILFSVFFTLGFLYRISSVIIFGLFTYLELIDITYYLNHYYFVSLVLFIMIFLPAGKSFSLDLRFGLSKTLKSIPNWMILSLQGQLALVYIFAGIAKINQAWLIDAMPLKIWLPAQSEIPIIGTMFTWAITPYLFSWFGMIYDCTIVFWLSWKKSRPIAYFFVVVFHLMTGLLFQIGVFPLVMILSSSIFFSEEWHLNMQEKINNALGLKEFKEKINTLNARRSALIPYGFILFFCFQMAFPFRSALYPGNTFWNEEGYRFSWRVMLMEKSGTATFYVKGENQDTFRFVDNSEFLNAHQEKQMSFQPDLILQYAHFLKSHYESIGIKSPEIKAEVYATLNSKESKMLINPEVNLALAKDSWSHKEWIIPYE